MDYVIGTPCDLLGGNIPREFIRGFTRAARESRVEYGTFSYGGTDFVVASGNVDGSFVYGIGEVNGVPAHQMAKILRREINSFIELQFRPKAQEP